MEDRIWLTTIQGALEELQAIPLWGSPPSFPWEAFSDALTKNFEQQSLVLTHHRTEWLKKEDFTKGMGDHPLLQSFDLSPLAGSFTLVIPRATQKQFIYNFLTKDRASQGFSDPALEEGFFEFILLNICQIFNELNPYGNLIASLAETTPLPEEGTLCIDSSISLNQKSLWFRVICPRETQASFKTYFTMKTPPLLSDPTLSAIPIPLKLEVGNTILKANEWEKVALGDLILLDRCTYDLNHNRGNALLVLGNTPLFDVRIKGQEIKILEYALYKKESPMSEENSFKEPNPSEMNEEAPLWSGAEESGGMEEMITSKKIPLTITVEVGRFQMPLQKLMQLKPGNVLDLSINPQMDVYLTMGGKRIAKGELVKLGESIGVKILDVGE